MVSEDTRTDSNKRSQLYPWFDILQQNIDQFILCSLFIQISNFCFHLIHMSFWSIIVYLFIFDSSTNLIFTTFFFVILSVFCNKGEDGSGYIIYTWVFLVFRDILTFHDAWKITENTLDKEVSVMRWICLAIYDMLFITALWEGDMLSS